MWIRKKVACFRIFLEKYENQLRRLWDVLNIGIIGLNSFILLLFKCGYHRGMNYVVCTGAAAYVGSLLLQAVFLPQSQEKRLLLARRTRKVFRLIYTALYLTVIMLDVITITAESTEGKESLLVYYGFLFIWVALWGTHCLWVKKVICRCSALFGFLEKNLDGFIKEYKIK